MAGHPLSVIEENGAEFLDTVETVGKSAFADGDLGVTQKLLIGRALDAAHGAADGVL